MSEAANDDHGPGIHPLKAWRQHRGLPIPKAASLLGVAPDTWRAWEERGAMPRHTNILKLFRLTSGKVTANAFVFPEGLPPPDPIET